MMGVSRPQLTQVPPPPPPPAPPDYPIPTTTSLINYYYPPPDDDDWVTSSSPVLSSTEAAGSSILSEYLLNGLSTPFLQKYSRELTVAASGLSVLILLLLGGCILCIFRVLKKEDGVEGKEEETRAGVRKEGRGITDTSECGGSESSVGKGNGNNEKGRAKEKKKVPIISKLFSKKVNRGSRALASHRNIVTPDKTIPFFVPTISLPAQPPQFSKKEPLDFPSPPEPQPSTSRSATQSKEEGKLLHAQQFYPQLEHPDIDSCPLIAFSLFYELSTQILNVRLLEGRNFPDTVSHSVGVKIYPGRSGKQQTKEFKTKSPVYNIEFCYHVRKTSLPTKILKLRAIIPGNPKRVIGYVNLAVKDLFGTPNEEEVAEDLKTSVLWRRVELPSEIGEGVKLQVSLKWSAEPGPGLLTLRIVEAAGLHENRDCDYTSSYVKVTLQEQGRDVKTRKTALVRWGSVPAYNDVFVLTIPQHLLTQISFLLFVIARGRLGSKAVLGKISIGPVLYAANPPTVSRGGGTCSGTEIWEDMCHQPDSEIVRWLHLLP